ncbi:unnamed protein product [Mytilus edulis]|uniref:AIG1-type G domain-containing protein n=1 Tax=Mytilus edulis TaxID=6550 RepID=A0A8S3RY67_MYTED|nr:unnamed protein product [Mytilus edulis]
MIIHAKEQFYLNANGLLDEKSNKNPKAFWSYFCNMSTSSADGVAPPDLPLRTQHSLDIDEITEDEIKDILKSLEIGKASGEDCISHQMLKYTANSVCVLQNVLPNQTECNSLNITEYDKRCPYQSEWKIKATTACIKLSNYYCIWDDYEKEYRKKCVLRGNLDSDECFSERFQPFTFTTEGYSDCIYKKSVCVDKGLVIHHNGSTKYNRKCRCDYARGYVFVQTPQYNSSCIPSQEDCSCFKKRVNIVLGEGLNEPNNSEMAYGSDSGCEEYLADETIDQGGSNYSGVSEMAYKTDKQVTYTTCFKPLRSVRIGHIRVLICVFLIFMWKLKTNRLELFVWERLEWERVQQRILLGRRCFEASDVPKLVTEKCTRATGTVLQKSFMIVDTPGICGINEKKQDTELEIKGVFSWQLWPTYCFICNWYGRIRQDDLDSIRTFLNYFGEKAKTISYYRFYPC